MSVQMHCDWTKCLQTIDPEYPTNWFIINRNVFVQDYSGSDAERHFCSATHAVAWLLKNYEIEQSFLEVVLHEDN